MGTRTRLLNNIEGDINVGAIVATSITDTGLTSGRVVIVGTGGLLEDDAGLTYNAGTNALSTGSAVLQSTLQWNASGNPFSLTSNGIDATAVNQTFNVILNNNASSIFKVKAASDWLTIVGSSGLATFGGAVTTPSTITWNNASPFQLTSTGINIQAVNQTFSVLMNANASSIFKVKNDASDWITVVGSTGLVTFGANAAAVGYYLRSVGNGLTATGTDRATALQLAAQVNNITTAAASTGVILPVGVVGMRITVFNAGANPVQVYASASETIDTVAGATGVPLTNAKRADFFYTVANTWISAQLGVVSA